MYVTKIWMDSYLISDHYLDPHLRSRSDLRLFFLDLCLRMRWTSNLKNKTQIAITEMDLRLRSDGDPIF